MGKEEGQGAAGFGTRLNEFTESRIALIAGTVIFLAGFAAEAFSLAAVSRVLFAAAYLILGAGVFYHAVYNLLHGHLLDENFLMSIATVGAFAIDRFSEAVGVMLFYRIGEAFEDRAMEKSRRQITEAIDMRPDTVILSDGTHIPTENAQVGDLLLIRPGDRIPLDGTLTDGVSRIDTAPITGEPVPRSVRAGDTVLSGCVNLSGQLTLRVDQPLSESTVTRILTAMENAAESKPKMDRFITRFSRVYTPTVVAAAVALPLFTGAWDRWLHTSLSFLIMSCPCALVLSVPLAFFSGIGVGSRRGILYKGGASVEALAGVRAVAMDKTGTLTQGDFRVREAEEPAAFLCACCEQYSSHPIAVSITAWAKERGMILREPQDLTEIAGEGISAELDGKRILCGNAKLLARHGIFVPELQGGGTVVFVARGGEYVGHLRISDTVKPGAAQMIARLQKLGLSAYMLTGDRENNAVAAAEEIGIRNVRAGLLPQEKPEKLRAIREENGAVLYVGDGINDAPVLAAADVGAAMGSGSDAALEAADVVFMTQDVQAIADSVQIARRTKRIAAENVILALGAKAAVMLLGLFGAASMWAAVLADSGVALLCVLNSVRFLYLSERK